MNPSYRTLEIGDVLFAEHSCGVTVKKLPNLTESDSLQSKNNYADIIN
ncbi:MAG TPA: hypothetical protein VFE51_04815 [Verrucomicrobiae bacterium]|nr:hypothetical protein [Verrucomicrobiae bacterium]